jgi:hypothetical protein
VPSSATPPRPHCRSPNERDFIPGSSLRSAIEAVRSEPRLIAPPTDEQPWHALGGRQVLERLGSTERGLDDLEAQRQPRRFGLNAYGGPSRSGAPCAEASAPASRAILKVPAPSPTSLIAHAIGLALPLGAALFNREEIVARSRPDPATLDDTGGAT